MRLRMDEEPHTALPRPEVDPLVLRRQRRRLFAELLGIEVEGARLDHYELLHELGRGAMGVVYAAHDTKLDRKVAIKQLSGDDPSFRRRLVAEARAMAKLNHPNVVPVHEIGEVEGAAFIVMAHVDGLPLGAWLAARPRSLAEILAVFRDAGRGLAAVHAKGLVHRDFKPDNVMVGEDGRARVMDFGVARTAAAEVAAEIEAPGASVRAGEATGLTRTGALIGTPAYMAPEQLRGLDATPASDQFAFCVALFEALHGCRPYEADDLPGLLAAIEGGSPPPGPRASEVPGWLRAVLERGLAAAAAERFASMDALLDALAAGERPREPPAFVFLAHRGSDTLAALELATGLLEHGVRAHFEPWEAVSLAGTAEPRRSALERAPALVIVHGPGEWTDAGSRALLDALDRRLAEGVPAWVVTLPDADPGALPSGWAALEQLGPEPELVARRVGVLDDRASWLAEEAAREGHGGASPETLRPYRGPEPFAECDARWMFGREREISELVTRLAEGSSRFVCVVGASGAGKSSLVHAGLCPVVRAGALCHGDEARSRWVIASMRPGARPCEALASALAPLAPALGLDASLDPDALLHNPNALSATLSASTGPADRLLLVVDQLEELFTEAGLSPRPEPSEAAAFVDNLVRATRSETGLRVVATLRADFIHRCLDIRALSRVLRGGTYFALPPMSAAQLRASIELPLRRVGYTIAPALVAELVAAAGERAERLPLLQHVLDRLWARRDVEARELVHAAWVDSGGLEGALTDSADRVLDRIRRELGAAGERAARRVLTRLVRPGRRERGDARRRAPRSELGDDPTTARVLDALVGDARVVVASEVGGREHFELAHDVLVRSWAPLVAWLDAERDALRLRHELRAGAERFAAHGEDPEYLWGRGRVDEARRVLAEGTVELLDDERAFLERSGARARQRERRIWLGFGGVFVVLVALLAHALRLAALNEEQAAENRALAEARASERARADEGVSAQKGMRATMMASERPDLEALLLAIEALGAHAPLGAGRPPPPDAYEGVLAALAMDTILGPVARLDGHGRKLVDVTFSPDGRWLASAGFDGRAQLWDARSGQPGAQLDGHEAALTTVAFSPDGRLLASASWDRTVRLWDVDTGEVEAVLRGHAGDVSALAFSPEGARLATGSADGSVRVWDPATGAELRRLDGHAGSISALAFSPDGTRLASASHDASARLWDPDTGALVHALEGHPSRVLDLAFSPDGATLVTCGYESIVRRWQVVDGHALAPLAGHRGSVVALAFAPDGETLATASFDDTARLWDARSGDALARFEGHTDDVLDLSFSPDGARLLTGSADGSARVWDTASGRELARLRGHDDAVLAVATSPTGEVLASASADGSGRLWAPSARGWTPVLGAHAGPVTALAHSRSGLLASAGHDGTIRLWPPSRPAKPTILADHRGAVLALAVSPDGRTLASAGHDTGVRLWDAGSGELLARFDGHRSHVVALAFSPDGRTLASASYDASVRIWGTQTRALLDTLDGHRSYVTALAFSPEGDTLASASHDASVRLWDVALGQQRARLDGHRGYVVSLATSPDGAILASGGADHELRLWDLASASPLAVLTGHEASVTQVLFGPTGERLISADAGGELRVWDVSERRLEARLDGHAGEVFALARSPDGTLLASAGADDSVRLWSLGPDQLLAELDGHRGDVLALSFAPDGRALASAGADGRVRVWPTPAAALALACARAEPFLDFARVAEICARTD